jgi:hypothetical protein
VETWDDDCLNWEEPGGIIVIGLPDVLIRYDRVNDAWTCTCRPFNTRGKCNHLLFYRRQVVVPVREEYL